MAYTSVTYSFSNSTTSDATQVSQNFTDIINGISDGTKDINVNALTAAGAAALNGNVSLGNGSPDDISWLGSLASSIPVKTTFSYDVGSSTIGLKSIYFGSNDSAAKTVRVIAGATGTSYTLTLPTSGGSAGQYLSTSGSGTLVFSSLPSAAGASNLGLSTSVAANALTVALKGADGNDPSATNVVNITLRNATATTGTPVTRSITSSLNMAVSSGASLGHTNNTAGFVYVYALDNSGTVELAVSSALYDEGSVATTTAMSGGATSATAIYSTTARSNVPITLIGRLKSTQTTAGTWAANATEISVGKFDRGINSWSGVTTTYNSSSTYTVPAGVSLVYAEVCAGGGGGGGASNNSAYYGGGGGGGSAFLSKIIAVTPGQSITVTVGAGGSAGSAGADGGTGGTSAFGSLSAAGATGGQGGGISSYRVGIPGKGSGSVGGFGMISSGGTTGNAGGSGLYAGGSTASSIAPGGSGGGGAGGVGGAQNASAGGSAAADNTGAGGGGGSYTTNTTGGAGGSGVVRVTVIQ